MYTRLLHILDRPEFAITPGSEASEFQDASRDDPEIDPEITEDIQTRDDYELRNNLF